MCQIDNFITLVFWLSCDHFTLWCYSQSVSFKYEDVVNQSTDIRHNVSFLMMTSSLSLVRTYCTWQYNNLFKGHSKVPSHPVPSTCYPTRCLLFELHHSRVGLTLHWQHRMIVWYWTLKSMPRHDMTCHVVSYHVISYHIMSSDVMLLTHSLIQNQFLPLCAVILYLKTIKYCFIFIYEQVCTLLYFVMLANSLTESLRVSGVSTGLWYK